MFKPITSYWCERPDGELACVVAEVHNTYQGRHAYLMHTDAEGRASADKELYVSPFQLMTGEYRLRWPRPGRLLVATLSLRHGTETPLTATLLGVRRPATCRGVARAVPTRSLVPQRVSALIRRHGIGLWARGATITPRTGGGEVRG